MIATLFILSLLFLVFFIWYLASTEAATRRWVGVVAISSLVLLCVLSLFHVRKGTDGRYHAGVNIKYGLDIQGGTQFVLGLEGKVKASDRDQAITVIRKRIDGLGLAEPIIQPSGDNRIIVQIPGVSEKDKITYRNQLQKVAKLEFRMVHPQSSELINQSKNAGGTIPFDHEVLSLIDHTPDDKIIRSEILVKRRTEMSGSYVKSAHRSIDQVGRPVVVIEFSSKGEELFAKLTERNIGQRMAIVLDNEVYSAPVIRTAIRGNCEISGGSMTPAEAEELASVLQNPLEVPVNILDERSVDPSLGKSSIEDGFRASLIGLAAVIVFMVLYYHVAGIVSVISLGFNMILLLGFLAQFGFTLTMPGVAGIILTIGMAVDSNVLIYERIREELDWGKPLIPAVAAGFYRAFSSILDANVTTIIAAAILFWQGSGPVQGFAVTLCLGVLSSMFAALVITREQFEVILSTGKLKSLSMARFIAHKTNINFMGTLKWVAISLSALLIIASIGGWVKKGDNAYGVDFVGGDLISYHFTTKISENDINSILPGEQIVSQYTHASRGDKEVLTVRAPYNKGEQVTEALQKKFPDAGIDAISTDRVGAVFGKELASKAFLALVLGLIGIFIYTMVRFESSYATGAIIAIIHDVIISLGIFILIGRELSLPAVGAVLTVAGYSINDTIVIFDRIREGLKSGYKGSLAEVMNQCINLTLSRTLITSGTTFIAVLALYLFGGVVINDFALILLVGIAVGTYSSIFIASPIVLWWGRGKKSALVAPATSTTTA